MGYCIEMKESNILIKKEKQEELLHELNNWAKSKNCIMWANKYELENETDLEDFFGEMRYECEFKEQNIVDLCFYGEKLGNDMQFFEIVLKYSKDGSYIEMLGEDGDLWRYQYINGKYGEYRPNF